MRRFLPIKGRMEARKPRQNFAYDPVPVSPGATPAEETSPAAAVPVSAAHVSAAHIALARQSDVSAPAAPSEQSHSAMPPIGGQTASSAGAFASARQVATSGVGAQKAAIPMGELTDERVRSLRRDVVARAKVTHAPSPLAEWLVTQGMPQPQAEQMASDAWRQEKARRAKARTAVASQQRADNGLAILEIIAGIVLLVAGLAAGWFVGLFLVPIIDGVRRLAN